MKNFPLTNPFSQQFGNWAPMQLHRFSFKPLIAFAIVFSALFQSCMKEDQIPDPIDSNSIILSKVIFYSDLHKSYNLDNSVSLESKSIQDGLWIIEATSNYDFATSYSNYYLDDFKTTQFTTSADLNTEGNITGESLMVAYNAIYNLILSETSNGRLLLINDVSISDQNASSITFNVEFETAVDLSMSTGKTESINGFGPTEYWYPIGDAGKCDIYAPAFAGVKDAMDKIVLEVNKSIPDPQCNGIATFGVDVENVTHLIEYMPSAPYYFEFLTDACLAPTTLETIHDNILLDIPNYRPTGKYEKSITMGYDAIYDGEPPFYARYYYNAKYANVICTPHIDE